MKRPVLLLSVLLAGVGADQAQEATQREEIQGQIQDLRATEADLEGQLQKVRAEIERLEREALERRLESVESVRAAVGPNAKIYDSPSINRKRLSDVPRGEHVTVLDIDSEGFMTSAIYGEIIGYIPRMYLYPEDPAVKDFLDRKLRLNLEEAKLKREQVAKEAKLSNEEQARQAELRRQAQAKERYARLVKKYGSTTGRKIAEGKIWLGITPEMARDSWGRPKDINRTVTVSGVREQWVYGSHQYLYFNNGILTSWQD